MMKVFAVNGVSLSGKDTFCNKYKLLHNNEKVTTISTIDPIKGLYKSFFGWKGEKTDNHRKNLNTLKLIWIEASNGPSEWLRDMLDELEFITGTQVVFVMVREFDEMMTAIEIGKEVCGHAETIQLIRDGIPVPPIEQAFLDSHPKDYVYDWTIVNPTTEDSTIPGLTKAAIAFDHLINKIRMHGVKYNPVVWNPVDEKFVEWISK
jgi:hypothetical protein